MSAARECGAVPSLVVSAARECYSSASVSGGGQVMSAPCAHLVGLTCRCWSYERVDEDFRRVQKKPLSRRGTYLWRKGVGFAAKQV